MHDAKKAQRELHKLLASIRNEREAKILLEDLLTPRERAAIGERWQLIRALTSGMKQREIKKKLKISFSKIDRGSRALRQGSGGFRYFLNKLKK